MRSYTLTMMMLVAALAWSSATADAAVFNVRLAPFNAVGDGTNDDTQEVQAAIDAAIADGGGEVYFPAATYRLSATLVSSSSLTFRGDGQRASTLRWQGLATGYNGISFFNASPISGGKYHTLTVRGLSLVRRDGFGGKAIWARWPEPTAGRAPYMQGNGSTALLEDFHIGNDPAFSATGSWDAGLYLRYAVGAKLSGFVIEGVGASTFAGIEVVSNDMTIHDGLIVGYQYGVHAWEDVEGLNLQNVIVRGARIGVLMTSPSKGNVISTSDISAKYRGISVLNGLGELTITGNQIGRLVGESQFMGIEVNNEVRTGRFVRILNNTIKGTPTAIVGILLYNFITDSIVQGNITQEMDYGIWLLGATNTTVMGNINRSASVLAIANGGTNNHCIYNAPVIAGNPNLCQ